MTSSGAGAFADRLRGFRRRDRLSLQAFDPSSSRLDRRAPARGRDLVVRRGRRRKLLYRSDCRRRDRRRARGAVMAPYVKPTRPEPTSEEFLALLGPLVYVARWLWRRLRELARGELTWPPRERPTRVGLYAGPRNAPKPLEASPTW